MSTLQENTSLQTFNTFGIDAKAKYFAKFAREEQLQALLEDYPHLPKLILGGGSNILFTKDYEGLVLKNELYGKSLYYEDAQEVGVAVGAGENWHQFVQYCIANNWAGVENLSLIPGTVGAAPMQNIGAYGVEVQQVIDWVEAIKIADRQIVRFSKEDCKFGYRESIFKHEAKDQYIITKVGFRLHKNPEEFNTSYGAIRSEIERRGIKQLSLAHLSEIICDIRRSKLPDPAQIGNGGSFFKNPETPQSDFERLQAHYPEVPHYPTREGWIKVPAGWLIEQAGWKGKRFGQIGVHAQQALVLVNYGGGRGADVWQLAQRIQNSVAEKFQIHLQPEINII